MESRGRPSILAISAPTSAARFSKFFWQFSATLLILLKGVVIYIPLAYVLQKYFGFCGILAALATTNFAVGLISYLWNRGMVTCHLASVCPRVVFLEFRTFEDIWVFAILSIVG
jgi:hypothetical protein